MLKKLRHRLAVGEGEYGRTVRAGLQIYGFLLSRGLSERQCFALAAALLGLAALSAGALIWALYAAL